MIRALLFQVVVSLAAQLVIDQGQHCLERLSVSVSPLQKQFTHLPGGSWFHFTPSDLPLKPGRLPGGYAKRNSMVNIYISQKTHEFGNAASHNAPACRENFELRDPVCSLLTNWIVDKREIHWGKVQLKKRGTGRIEVISLPEVGKPRPVNPAKRLVFVSYP